MFIVGQKVIHYREGLSVISGEKEMGGNDYFVVTTLSGSGDNIFVMKNHTSNIIREVLNKAESLKAIELLKSIQLEIQLNTKQRRDSFKRRLISGNIDDLCYLMKQLYYYNLYFETEKSFKLGPSDVEMLRSAEKMFLDEMALSLEIDREKIKEYIISKL